MTDKPTTAATGDAGPAGTPGGHEDARFDDLGDLAVAAPDSPRVQRFALPVAALALVVAILALAAASWALLRAAGGEDSASTAYVDRLAADLRDAGAAAQSLEQRVADLAAARDAMQRNTDAAEQRLADRLRSFDDLGARVAGLESSFAALRGISTGVRDAWLLAEAEYYLQIANAQVQLAGNPDLATLALGLADETLRAIADPGLIEVRRALADERQRLEAIERPDIEGATLTLASLAAVVDDLPLRADLTTEEPAPSAEAPADEPGGAERALASLKRAVSGIVTVRRSDAAVRPLIAPDAAYFLRANLALQLQAARLGLLRGEQVIFRQSLDDALGWLHTYYDADSTAVKSALLTISEIRNSAFAQALPDISESLRLLRQYMAFRDATREDSPAEPDAGQPQ